MAQNVIRLSNEDFSSQEPGTLFHTKRHCKSLDDLNDREGCSKMEVRSDNSHFDSVTAARNSNSTEDVYVDLEITDGLCTVPRRKSSVKPFSITSIVNRAWKSMDTLDDESNTTRKSVPSYDADEYVNLDGLYKPEISLSNSATESKLSTSEKSIPLLPRRVNDIYTPIHKRRILSPLKAHAIAENVNNAEPMTFANKDHNGDINDGTQLSPSGEDIYTCMNTNYRTLAKSYTGFVGQSKSDLNTYGRTTRADTSRFDFQDLQKSTNKLFLPLSENDIGSQHASMLSQSMSLARPAANRIEYRGKLRSCEGELDRGFQRSAAIFGSLTSIRSKDSSVFETNTLPEPTSSGVENAYSQLATLHKFDVPPALHDIEQYSNSDADHVCHIRPPLSNSSSFDDDIQSSIFCCSPTRLTHKGSFVSKQSSDKKSATLPRDAEVHIPCGRKTAKLKKKLGNYVFWKPKASNTKQLKSPTEEQQRGIHKKIDDNGNEYTSKDPIKTFHRSKSFENSKSSKSGSPTSALIPIVVSAESQTLHEPGRTKTISSSSKRARSASPLPPIPIQSPRTSEPISPRSPNLSPPPINQFTTSTTETKFVQAKANNQRSCCIQDGIIATESKGTFDALQRCHTTDSTKNPNITLRHGGRTRQSDPEVSANVSNVANTHFNSMNVSDLSSHHVSSNTVQKSKERNSSVGCVSLVPCTEKPVWIEPWYKKKCDSFDYCIPSGRPAFKCLQENCVTNINTSIYPSTPSHHMQQDIATTSFHSISPVSMDATQISVCTNACKSETLLSDSQTANIKRKSRDKCKKSAPKASFFSRKLKSKSPKSPVSIGGDSSHRSHRTKSGGESDMPRYCVSQLMNVSSAMSTLHDTNRRRSSFPTCLETDDYAEITEEDLYNMPAR